MKRVAQALLVLIATATFIAPAQPSDAQTTKAQTDAPLGGYQGVAAASGIHALYNLEGVLPLPPPVDLGAPDAYTTIATGPATFARASVADPGDLLASPDTLLSLFSSAYPAGTIPPYPFRISATSGVGAPGAESNPAPGLNARVAATESESVAQATMPTLDAPSIATVGTSSALATTKTDGSTVTVTARTKTSDINVLGLLKIGSIVTDLTATSSGNGTKLSGGTTVVGATLGGQAITIDAEGVHRKPGSKPVLPLGLGSLTGTLNEQLARLGLRIAVAGPFEAKGGNAGQLGSSGLRIEFRFGADTLPVLINLINSLPPIDNPVPGAPLTPEDVLAAAKAHHLLSIEIGRGLVSLSAREAAVFDDEAPVDDSGLPVLALGDSFDLPDAPVSLTPGAPRPALRPTTTAAAALPSATGVGALILLALLAVPFIGELIARACGAVLATNESEICVMEEQQR